MRLLNENTANESSCFKKKFTKHVCAHLSFYEPDILHNNDIMQRFTYNEKNRDDFYSIMDSISHLGKMARTSAKSENPSTSRCSLESSCGDELICIQLWAYKLA